MQCLVFADGDDHVIKIYEQSAGLENLNRLMQFYASLDQSSVAFSLPEIIAIGKAKSHILVREKRLYGISPTLDNLNQFSSNELTIFFRNYVDVLFQIQNIKTNFLEPGEPLDQTGDFIRYSYYGSWQSLLISNVLHKQAISGSLFLPYVPDLKNIVDRIVENIPLLPYDKNDLIHGDFYPANTLMDQNFNITAVLDFGTYTLVGDPIYDIALGWIFADMYQNVKPLQAVDFVGDLIRERLSVEEFRRMKLYILIYSLLSADIYCDPDAPDGHFQWAMNNLNNKDFREVL